MENLAVEIKKVYAEIDNLVKDGKLKEAEANKIRNNDIATLLIDGEYGKALVSTGVEAGKDLMKAGSFIVGAKNFGGLGALANMGKAKRYLSSLGKKHPMNQVQEKLKKSVGENELMPWLKTGFRNRYTEILKDSPRFRMRNF